MSRFGIGTLPRKGNAAMRGRSQEVYGFNHHAVRIRPKESGDLDRVEQLGIVHFYQKLVRIHT